MRGSVIAYASRTGTRRNLDGLRRAGWRLMVSAKGVLRHEGFRYALDNGAWTAYQNGQPFDEEAFMVAVNKLGNGADWIVIPDIVAGGKDSLAFSLSWIARLEGIAPLLLAVQDGITVDDVRPIVGKIGIFVGGSTEFKLGTLMEWGALARETGCYLHVGRVNSPQRIKACAAAGADSFDGSNASRFSVNLDKMDVTRRISDMFALMRLAEATRR